MDSYDFSLLRSQKSASQPGNAVTVAIGWSFARLDASGVWPAHLELQQILTMSCILGVCQATCLTRVLLNVYSFAALLSHIRSRSALAPLGQQIFILAARERRQISRSFLSLTH